MLLPVAPVLQCIVPPPEGEVLSVVDAPLQSSVPALLLTVGATGVVPVVVIILLLLAELGPVPQLLVMPGEYAK